MDTLVKRGKSIEAVTPAGGYTSGQPVVVGSVVGISVNTYAEGETAVIWLVGAHLVPKAAEPWAPGDRLYFDSTNNLFTKVATDNAYAGYAQTSAISSDPNGIIILRQ